MFAKERMGFMPALQEAFLEALGPGERRHFEDLAGQQDRAGFVMDHPFVKEKFGGIELVDRKDNSRSVAAREEGNRQFQEGQYQVGPAPVLVLVPVAEPNTCNSTITRTSTSTRWTPGQDSCSAL